MAAMRCRWLPAILFVACFQASSGFGMAPMAGRSVGLRQCTGRVPQKGGAMLRMQSQGSSLGEEVATVFGALKAAPSRLSEVGAGRALVELGEAVTGTDLYRVYAQGAVVLFIAALHVVSQPLLQSVGTFHVLVCLPLALVSASSKGHEVGPAVAKTLLVGGLAAAQVVFSTDENQARWPSTIAASGSGSVMGQAAELPVAAGGNGAEPKQGLPQLMQAYGKVAVLTHFTIMGTALGLVYEVVSAMEVDSVIAMLPAAVASKIDPSAGSFAIAFILVKLSSPFRIALDFALAPVVASALKDTPLAGPLGLKQEA